MDAWGKDLKVGDKIAMLADPQGTFVKELGLDFDASGMFHFVIGWHVNVFHVQSKTPEVLHLNVLYDIAALGGHRSKRFALVLEVHLTTYYVCHEYCWQEHTY